MRLSDERIRRNSRLIISCSLSVRRLSERSLSSMSNSPFKRTPACWAATGSSRGSTKVNEMSPLARWNGAMKFWIAPRKSSSASGVANAVTDIGSLICSRTSIDACDSVLRLLCVRSQVVSMSFVR